MSNIRQKFLISTGILVFFGLVNFQPNTISYEAWIVASLLLLMTFWWLTEAIPLSITAILPLIVIPSFTNVNISDVAKPYANPVIFLLLGGFILGLGFQKSNLHLRFAMLVLKKIGSTKKSILGGIILSTAFLSMWISNTATTLMLLPVALAVIERSRDPKLAIPLLLGIAYAASVGGIGTPIGTPPNLVFREIYEQTTGTEIGFLTWMMWGMPVVLLFIPIIGFWLTRTLNYQGKIEMPAVGQWQTEERRVFIVFSITALAWITRSEPFGGWSEWLNVPEANDASVALIAVVIMFLVPDGKGNKLLDWETAGRIPWGMLILFGGGIAIAKAFIASGLSAYLGDALAGLAGWPILLLISIICLAITFLTEMTSNTATTTLMMPILAAAAIGADIDPALLMVPAAMSASCAFMLPVATAPNTIVFSTGRFTTALMAREGSVLNIIGIIVVSFTCYLLL